MAAYRSGRALPVVALTLVLAATLASCDRGTNGPQDNNRPTAAAPAPAPPPPPSPPPRELAWSGKVDMNLWSAVRVKAYKVALKQETPRTLAILRIPRLNLEVPVYDGTADAVFDLAAGRIEDTALPGTPGNVGIAAHRDGYFRVLKDIKEGDALVLDTPVATERIPRPVDQDHYPQRRQRDPPHAHSCRDTRRLLPVLLRGSSPEAVYRARGARGGIALGQLMRRTPRSLAV